MEWHWRPLKHEVEVLELRPFSPLPPPPFLRSRVEIGSNQDLIEPEQAVHNT
jgi:hypothetical protein